jgi:hypothetical protein
MALTRNFATDEKTMREAVADLILTYALGLAGNLFDAAHIHTRPRFVATEEKWAAAALVADPDDAAKQVMRMSSVETASSLITSREWAIDFDVKVGWGFTDERPDDKGNSYDEVTAFAYGLLQFIFENQSLGVDDAITITRVRHLRTRFVKQDAQGRAAHVADLFVSATVEVC